MLPSALSLVVVLVASTLSFEAKAEVVLRTLQNNPFNRPDILKPKPAAQQPSRQAEPLPQQVSLELTATLVSESTPMVVVDGKLLGIGESIKGFRLIAVTEGGAVFARQGKKYSLTVAEENDETRSDD